MTLTEAQQKAIRDVLDGMPVISNGVGTRESACSVAAMNLGLTGELTDDIPACMSEVIGAWMILAQDEMPAEMRNSPEWREILPLAAGTGREREPERLKIILDWMWEAVLIPMQDAADEAGIGPEWRRMCEERSQVAVNSLEKVTRIARLRSFMLAAEVVGNAINDGEFLYVRATEAAWAARHAAKVFNRPDFWHDLDPIGLLRRLVEEGR